MSRRGGRPEGELVPPGGRWIDPELMGLALTRHQVFWSTFVLRSTVSISLLPVLTASRAGRDAWAASLVGTGLGLLLVGMFTYPAVAYAGAGLAGQHRQALGRWLGPAVSLAYLWLLLHLTALTLREYAEAIVTAILPTTPLEVVVGVTTLLAGVAAGQNTPALGRMAVIIGGVLVFSLVALTLMVAPVAEAQRLLPAFRTGWAGIASGGLLSAAWHSQAIFLLPVAPATVDVRGARRAALWATLASGLTEAMLAALSVAVMAGELAVKAAFPLFEVARQVEVGEFLQRVDALVVGAWGLGLIMSASLLFHAGSVGLTQLAGLHEHSVLVNPMMVLLAVLALRVAENDLELRRFSDVKTLVPYLFIVLWLPAAVLALRAWRAVRPAGDGP